MNLVKSLEPLNELDFLKKKEEFRKSIDFELPESFFKFLYSKNIAKPLFTSYKGKDTSFNLNYFFGFSENKYRDFAHNLKVFSGRIPQRLFPIASVDGGDLLCMDKEDEKIYFWSHEENDWGLEGNDNWPLLLADNIESLIASLLPSEQPTSEELERAKKIGKVTKTTPLALKFKNQARAKKGLPPLTMEDFS